MPVKNWVVTVSGGHVRLVGVFSPSYHGHRLTHFFYWNRSCSYLSTRILDVEIRWNGARSPFHGESISILDQTHKWRKRRQSIILQQKKKKRNGPFELIYWRIAVIVIMNKNAAQISVNRFNLQTSDDITHRPEFCKEMHDWFETISNCAQMNENYFRVFDRVAIFSTKIELRLRCTQPFEIQTAFSAYQCVEGSLFSSFLRHYIWL